MERYEVQELKLKPKIIKNFKNKTDEIRFDIEIQFYLEFENGKKTPITQFRKFEDVQFDEIEKIISTRIVNNLPLILVRYFYKLVQNDEINIQDLIQFNKNVIFKVSTKNINEIVYLYEFK